MPITHLPSAGSGTFTLTNPVSASNRTITLPDATTTLVGTDTTQALTNKTIQGGVITRATAVTASGTAVDFTGIPSWVKRVTVMFNGVSLSGTSDILVQLGTSGGIVSSGYVGSSIWLTTSGSGRTATTGYLVYLSLASRVFTGTMLVTNITGNTWVENTTGSDESTNVIVGGGRIALSGTLDRIRITTINGTDTFDAGTINIMYEG